jgi:hypothetical protein
MREVLAFLFKSIPQNQNNHIRNQAILRKPGMGKRADSDRQLTRRNGVSTFSCWSTRGNGGLSEPGDYSENGQAFTIRLDQNFSQSSGIRAGLP